MHTPLLAQNFRNLRSRMTHEESHACTTAWSALLGGPHPLRSGPLCFAQSPLDTSHAYGPTSGGPCRQLPHVRIGFWLIPTNQKILRAKPPSLTTTLTFSCLLFGGGQDKYFSLFPMNVFCLVVMLIKWTTSLQIDEGALLQLRCTVSTIQRFTLTWSVKI